MWTNRSQEIDVRRVYNKMHTRIISSHNDKKSLLFSCQKREIRIEYPRDSLLTRHFMKNQKGFTLVELMVVMAIIAILATAGISQYGRFIKSARDTTRITDLQAINVVILDSIQSTGLVPIKGADDVTDVDALKKAMKNAAGKEIYDKITGFACLEKDGKKPTKCQFQYAVCDGGTGYVLSAVFESPGNVSKYTHDDVGGGYEGSDELYEIGSCAAASPRFNPISAPSGGTTTDTTTDTTTAAADTTT